MINPESAAVCANCGAATAGAYCAACGQKTDVDPRSLRQWMHGILEDTLSIDGRLFQTLKALLTRPGFLTQEWRRGRQARWMHPFRLYLLASAIYFGVVALTPREFVEVTVEDAAGLDIGMEAEIAAYGEAAAASAPRAMFLAVPLFALLLLLLFRGSGWLYTEHLVNALHLHAFFFLVLAVTWPLELLPSPWDFWLQTPLMILMLVYFLRALQNTYGGNVATLALRAVPLGIVYTICLAALVLIGGGLVGGAESELQKSEERYWSVRVLDDAGAADRDRQISRAQEALVSYRRTENWLVTPEIRVHMGDLLLLLDQPERARREAEAALLVEPQNLLAIGLLGRSSEAAGDPAAAERTAARFLEAYRSSTSAVDSRHQADLDRYLAWAEEAAGGAADR